MKKLSTLTLSLVLIAATSFATPRFETENKKVAEIFFKMFSSAKSIQWEKTVNFTKARFEMNGSYLSAYFTPESEFMGLSRNITSEQLPLHLLADLKKNYAQYWITELFEYASEGADDYFVTLESAEKLIVLKGNSSGFSVYKKTNK